MPMKNRTRHILFYLAIAIFFIFAPGLTLYSLGYRFDWQAGTIRKVGMIIIEAKSKEVRVYLNNKLVSKESPAKIKNLLPGEYQVRVENDGYLPWEKRLTVKSQEVSWASHIILVKKNPLEKIISENTAKYFNLSPNGETLAYISEEKHKKGIWIKKIKNGFLSAGNDDKSNEKNIFPSEIDAFTRNNNLEYVNFTRIEFLDDENLLFSWTINDNSAQYGLINTNKENLLYLSDLFGLNIKNVKIRDNYIYFIDGNVLKKTDFSAKKAETIQLDVLDYVFFKNSLFYIKNVKNATVLVDSANNSKKIARFEKTNSAELKLSSSGYFAYNDRGRGRVYIYVNGNKKEISDKKVNGLLWSKSGDKLIFHSDFEIYLYYINNDKNFIHPEYLANTTELITRISRNIDSTQFFNSEHGIYATDEQLSLFEFDSRDKRNVSGFNLKIAAKIAPIIYDKTLYFLRATDRKVVAIEIE